METFERSRVHAYLRRITDQLPVPRRPAVVLVTHLFPERSLFVAATARLASLAAVLPKPRSAGPAALAEVAQPVPGRARLRPRPWRGQRLCSIARQY
jgi:hypothetical protein